MEKVGDFTAVQRVLEDLDFPATKDQIVQHAERHGGDPDAVRLLRTLPLGDYRNMSEIRSSILIHPGFEDGETVSEKGRLARKARTQHGHLIAEHLRDRGPEG
jgi:hypothetical protein